MKKSQEELTRTLELLHIEKEEELRLYYDTIKNLELDERKKKGVSWFPLNIIKTGYALGDLPFLIVERTTQLDERHQFQSGAVVSLFSEHPESRGQDRKGIIHYADRNKMKIILYRSPLPYWLDDGKLGVDLLFDDRTFTEMEKAIKTVLEAKKNRLAELREILLGYQVPGFTYLQNTYELPVLNDSQNRAVQQILTAKDVALVHGPPGTGKTTTLVQAIKQLSKVENTILVCAPSNTATDLLTERLVVLALNVVRVGNISRVDETIIQHTLDAQLAKHPESKTIKKVKKQAAEMRRRAGKFKRKFGSKEREERRELYQEAKALAAWAVSIEDRVIDQLLSDADVITSTLVGSTSKYLKDRSFKTVVIDEAGQAMEPATWIPITKAQKVILVGDPLQLPPTIKSLEAKRDGLSQTLLEKGITRLPEVSLLDTQYRMHEQIMGFSNQEFYKNQLKADESVRLTKLSISDNFNRPLEFIDTAGCGFGERINEETQSRFNPDEFTLLREHLYQLLDQYSNERIPNIGIISPYREQVLFMQAEIDRDEKLSTINELIVNTIDAFQGQERDIIYISLVRSNEHGEIGFLSDYRRMNVAMTRARKKLVMIGDSGTLGAHRFYQNFLDYCEKVGGYDSAWTYIS